MTSSTILVLVYPEATVADEVLEAVHRLQSESHLSLDDACVVLKDAKGKLKLHQNHNLPVIAATGGAVLGSIIGMIFLIPYVGAALGAAAGALGGKLAEIGIDDDFIQSLGQEIKPGSSALFLLLKTVDLEKCVPELASYGGTILHTSFSANQERELIRRFDEARGLSSEYHL
jgi:uncharacterized membrane protein